MRQVNALSATPFKLALNRAIQDIHIQGTTVNQMTQLFGYADDTALMSGSTADVR
jgi:hypothetical protein